VCKATEVVSFDRTLQLNKVSFPQKRSQEICRAFDRREYVDPVCVLSPLRAKCTGGHGADENDLIYSRPGIP
jgi:hypothetical protein